MPFKRSSLSAALLTFGGVWEGDVGEKHKILQNVYSNIVYIYCILYAMSQFVIIKDTYHSSILLFENLGMAFIVLLIIVKVFVIRMSKNKILNILNVLENDDKMKELHDNDEIILNIREKAKKFVIFISATYCTGSFSYHFFNSFLGLRRYLLTNENDFVETGGNVTCFQILTFHSWFPFPTDSKKYCGWALTLQFLAQLFLVTQQVAIDTLVIDTEYKIATHFHIVQFAFTSMKLMSIKNSYDDSTFQKVMNESMKKYSKHLQLIINLTLQVESLFTYINLGVILTSLFAIAATLSTIKGKIILAGNFGAPIFFLCLICHVGLFSAFGNYITEASGEIPTAIYSSEWYSCCSRYKTNMIINMIRLQKPLYLTIGKFSPMSLSTLIFILRGTYSVYSVFNARSL